MCTRGFQANYISTGAREKMEAKNKNNAAPTIENKNNTRTSIEGQQAVVDVRLSSVPLNDVSTA